MLTIFQPKWVLAEAENMAIVVTGTIINASASGKTLIPSTPSTPDEKRLHPPDVQRILDRGQLVVAMYQEDTPPFYFKNKSGSMDGIDVHLITGFATQLGVTVRFDRSASSFEKVVDLVATHQADLAISKLGMTFSRAMRVRYSKPYITLHQALLINRLVLAQHADGRERAEVMRNLDGKLGVIAKSSYVDNAKARFKKATVVGFDSWEKVVDATARGEVMAAYRDEVEIKKIILDRPGTALQFLMVVLTDANDPKAIITPWESPNLLALVDFFLNTLDLNLTADRILHHYDDVIQEIESKIRQGVR
ncbi:MAG: transporter substrate-binding domain-containing protein [Magnetococcus sp. DMHC-6]